MNTTDERIAKIKAAYEEKIAEIDRRRDYRMKNYYDCVDDYSWGGICDKADNIAAAQAAHIRDLEIDAVLNDGWNKVIITKYALADADGNIVSETVKSGKFGYFWVVNDTCVGVPFRLSTLVKKGYYLVKIVKTYKGKFTNISNNGNYLFKDVCLIDKTIEGTTNEDLKMVSPEVPFFEWRYGTEEISENI